MKRIIIFLITILIGFVFFIKPVKTAKAISSSEQIVGGQCNYDEFNGLCKVMNLYFNPEKADTKLVKFRFQPDIKLSSLSLELLKKNNINDTDQERTLNEVVPADWSQHDKNQVQIGDVMSCQLKIENSGTCTPIIFSFLEIQKNPNVFDDLTLKQLIVKIVIFLVPIIIIIAFFILKFKKFMHKFNKIRKRKERKE